MKALLSLLVILLATTGLAEESARRFLYMSNPDGAQPGGEPGILIFDIDKNYAFVRRIDIPAFKEGMRGFTGSLATKCVYFSTTNKRLGAFHLEQEEILWNQQYDRGCDRSCITMDGRIIYAPSGWWYGGQDAGFIMIDAATGDRIKNIAVGKRAHNSIASLDGKYVYLGTQTRLTQFDAQSGDVIQHIEPVGESGVFPYTVDSRNEYAYVCLGKHVGFDVVDLKAGKAIHRVKAGEQPIKHRTHGAGMTPDESELWVSDQKGKKLFVFDLTKMPPAPKGHVELSAGGHGWVTFTLDGKHALCHTPDVFDVKTKKRIAELKDGNGKRVSSSKFIEVQFRDGKVVRVGNEFGLGRVNAGSN